MGRAGFYSGSNRRIRSKEQELHPLQAGDMMAQFAETDGRLPRIAEKDPMGLVVESVAGFPPTPKMFCSSARTTPALYDGKSKVKREESAPGRYLAPPFSGALSGRLES